MHGEISQCCLSMESQRRVVLEAAINPGGQAAQHVHDSLIVAGKLSFGKCVSRDNQRRL